MATETPENEQEITPDAEFSDLYDNRSSTLASAQQLNRHHQSENQAIPYHQIEYLHDVKVDLFVEFGRSRISLGDLLNLKKGNVINTNKISGELVDVLTGETVIARGEIVIVNERVGIRIAEILRPLEREMIESQDQQGD